MLFLSFLTVARVFDSTLLSPGHYWRNYAGRRPTFLSLSGYFPTQFPSRTTGKNYLSLHLLSIFSSLLNVQVNIKITEI